MKLTNLSLLVFALAFIAAGSAQAALPAMPEIPVTLPDTVREPLIAKRHPLALRKLALIDEGKAINQQCAKVEKGSSQHQACLARQAQFNANVASLNIEVDKLEDEIDATIEADKKRLAALNPDTSVVDARVPRDGAYLTAQVPELARSPAADRISKGFQAVINRDWPVALAWWKGALQRDPNNAALKRSVDLAQWMVDRRKAVAAGPVTPLSAAIHAAARGDNAEAIRQFELAKVENPASATHVDSMIATIRQKSAQKVEQAAMSAEIVRQQILLVGELNDEGLKMLLIGMDKEAQKNFDDAQFFSMGLSPKQVKSYDSPYFGSMNVVPNQPLPKKAKPKP